jgi:hypothetical protein
VSDWILAKVQSLMADTLLDGFYSLASPVNKSAPSDEDSIVGDLLPELALSMTDAELIDLKRDWLKQWAPYAELIEKKQKENEDYWLGHHFNSSEEKRPLVDNLIFESLETFLPIATRPKLDPIVEADNTEPGNALADKVRKMLVHLSDTLAYNLKMKQVARYWALYMLGAMKLGWSLKENDITCAAIRPQKLILDPKATIEECEYTGYYIGEYLEDMASDLILRFPAKEAFIKEKVKGKLGTTVQYILWTTDDYVFWTLEDEVLAKNKNPHWNYEQQQSPPMDEYGQSTGQPQTIPPKNHFKNRKKPYIFLTFFNLGKQPHDDTNLIQQNLPLQDLVNKRLIQIDKNADNANGGLAVSGDSFTEEQAGKAAKAIRKGGVIWVPTGDVRAAVYRGAGAQLPAFIYQSLVDYREEIRNVFGVRGSTAAGTIQDKTAHGKAQIKGQDGDRIGGGISTMLEEFSDLAMNWFVQLMYVHYDEPHFATVLGKENTQQYIKLSNDEFGVKLTVGVKEGSMLPQDPVAKRQDAIQLWSEHALDPITLFERLEFPNPRESAKNLFLWLSDPVQLFPDLAAAAAANAKPENKPPSVAINFKDLPPEGQVQAAAEANIKLDATHIVAHQAAQKVDETRQMIQQHKLDQASALSDHARNMEMKHVDTQAKEHLSKVKPKPVPGKK